MLTVNDTERCVLEERPRDARSFSTALKETGFVQTMS